MSLREKRELWNHVAELRKGAAGNGVRCYKMDGLPKNYTVLKYVVAKLFRAIKKFFDLCEDDETKTC